MKTYLAATIAAAALFAAPASAAQFIDFDGESGAFGNDSVGAGSFSNTFTFTIADDSPLLGNGSLNATISTTSSSAETNIDFTSVMLNGSPFTLFPAGAAEFGSITLTGLTAGTQTLVVNGTSGGNGAFAGTITFAPGAIPEPATWAMMIAGFGLVGSVVRRRSTRLVYSA